MGEWTRLTANAPAEGVLIEHINDWFACMTADAVVKVRASSDMHVHTFGMRMAST